MSELIDPRVLATITDLELAGRLIAEGYLSGRHHGRRLGQGVEFAQYRPWQHGEDARRIDWRLYARSERLYLRETELDADVCLWLIVDHSASMAQRTVGAALSKFEYARYLAAALGYLAQHQDDQLALIGLGADSRVLVPPGAGRRQWYRLLAALESLRPAGRVADFQRLPANLLDATEAGLVIAISDFYQHEGEWAALLNKLAAGNREVSALCLECSDEIEFSYPGVVRFVDLETGEPVVTRPRQVRRAYRQARERYLAEVRARLVSRGVAFERLNVDRPLDLALRHYLQRRQAQAVNPRSG